MSYARFSSSNWYIYWSTGSGDTTDDQLLVIMNKENPDERQLYYRQLKNINNISQLKKLLNYINEIEDKEYQFCLEKIKKWKKEVEHREQLFNKEE